MVHLQPLPGAPRWGGSLDAVRERALADARALAAGGVDGILVENFGDAPFYPGAVPPETIAAMATLAAEVVRAVGVPVGVNVLRNDAAAALAVAAAAGARFIRVNVHTGAMLTDQGWIEGRAHETLRLRARIAPGIAIAADVLVKHATPPAGADLRRAAADTWERGLADVLIVSGEATGKETDPARIRAVKAAVPEATVWVGSGVRPENAAELLAVADGAIIGSAFERGGRAGEPVEPERVRAVMEAVARARAAG
jgi:membrane complex biogenesis BtpA family protein